VLRYVLITFVDVIKQISDEIFFGFIIPQKHLIRTP